MNNRFHKKTGSALFRDKKEGRAMKRDEALELVKSKVSQKNLIKHMLATEVIMRVLARRFGEDEERWALAGLLHDLAGC